MYQYINIDVKIVQSSCSSRLASKSLYHSQKKRKKKEGKSLHEAILSRHGADGSAILIY